MVGRTTRERLRLEVRALSAQLVLSWFGSSPPSRLPKRQVVLTVTSKVRKLPVSPLGCPKAHRRHFVPPFIGKPSVAHSNAFFSLLVKMCTVLAPERRKRNDLRRHKFETNLDL